MFALWYTWFTKALSTKLLWILIKVINVKTEGQSLFSPNIFPLGLSIKNTLCYTNWLIHKSSQTLVWIEFREAKKGYKETEHQFSAITVYSVGGGMFNSTEDNNVSSKEFFEDLFSPSDMPSAKKAEADKSLPGLKSLW